MKVCTIRDIAREAGVSVTTVSRVLNRRPDVNAETRRKVEYVIQKYHFAGNINARGLKQDRKAVGIIVHGHSNPFLSALSEALLLQAKSLPISFITEFVDEMDDEFLNAVRLAAQNRLDGLIFIGCLIDKRANVIRDLNIPIVFTTVDGSGADLPLASSVTIDDRKMGRWVGDQLIQLGHRNIAVLGANPVYGDSLSKRLNGFLEALKSSDIPFRKDLFRECLFTYDSGYSETMDIFRNHHDVTALFAMSDVVAIGAMRALKDLNIDVPGKVSVFGFDGIRAGDFTVPRLSTIEQPVDEIAEKSIRLLIRMLDRDETPQHLVIESVPRIKESLSEVHS